MINKNDILAVSNSLLKYYGLPIYHPSLDILDKKLLNKHKNIILLILDGMGVDLIEKNLSKDSFIRQHIIAQLSSVFPQQLPQQRQLFILAYHHGKVAG